MKLWVISNDFVPLNERTWCFLLNSIHPLYIKSSYFHWNLKTFGCTTMCVLLSWQFSVNGTPLKLFHSSLFDFFFYFFSFSFSLFLQFVFIHVLFICYFSRETSLTKSCIIFVNDKEVTKVNKKLAKNFESESTTF